MNENLIAILEKQESLLRFSHVSYSVLHEIGERLRAKAESLGGAVYIQIRLSGFIVYALAMDGTTRNNALWAMRKANTSELSGRSSMHDGLVNRARGRTLRERGLDEENYTEEGGSFPIMLKSGVTIGSITVSGMKSEEDHQMIASVLSEYLGIEIPSVIM